MAMNFSPALQKSNAKYLEQVANKKSYIANAHSASDQVRKYNSLEDKADLKAFIGEIINLKKTGDVSDEVFSQLLSLFVSRYIESEVQRKLDSLLARQLILK